MKIEEAIKKAIKGGWKKGSKLEIEVNEDGVWVSVEPMWKGQLITELHHTQILLDPSFWQALGKSMGWIEVLTEKECKDISKITGEKHGKELCVMCDSEFHQMLGLTKMPVWKAYWFLLIDHLSKGKTVESFFKNLT